MGTRKRKAGRVDSPETLVREPGAPDATAARPSDAPFGAYAIGIFVVAMTVRIVHLFQIHTAPFYPLLMGDAGGYDAWARTIADGDWLGQGVFYQAPLYPYFIALIYKFFEQEPTLVRVIQMALGSMACALIALTAHRLFGKRQGIFAGLLLAFFSPAIFFAGLIQKTSIDLFLFCWLIWLIALCVEEVTALRAAGMGLVLGALILTRENALVFVPVLFVWLLARAPARRSRALVFVCGLTAALMPVAVRNYKVSGEWHLTTAQSGTNLFIGNHESATGTYAPLRRGRGSVEFEQADAVATAKEELKRDLTAGEVSRYWRGRALDWIRSHPTEWLSLTGRKLMLALNAVETADTEDLYTHAEWSTVLGAADAILHFGVLAPLGLFGMWLVRSRFREIGVLHVMALIYLGSVLLFYVVARYRFPLVPLLVLFASAALGGLPLWWKNSRPGERAMGLTLLAMAIVLCNWPTQSTTAMRAVTRYNMGDALRKAGRNDEAAVQFQAALALDPANSGALSNLGALAAAKGDRVEALRLFKAAVAADPQNAAAHNNLGQELSMRGQLSEADESFRRAKAADPLGPEAHQNLATSLASRGRVDEAIREFEDAIRLDPTDARTQNNLGILLASAGRIDEGIARFTEALRLKPDFAEAAANLQRAEGMRRAPQ